MRQRPGPPVSAARPPGRTDFGPRPGDRRIPIPPFIAAYYLFCLAAIVIAWLKGGHLERLGAVAVLVVFGLSFLFGEPVRVWNVAINDAASDLGLALFFGWLALSRERWWPLFMTAVMVLTLLVHVAMFVVPTMGAYAEVSARIGLGITMALALLAGAAERWLAGERAVSDQRIWARRPPPPSPPGDGLRLSEGAAPSRPSY